MGRKINTYIIYKWPEGVQKSYRIFQTDTRESENSEIKWTIIHNDIITISEMCLRHLSNQNTAI
jgi:hypothetical protein